MIKKIKQKIYNLLHWSEKYAKTDMVYLAKGGSWLTLGQIVSSASAFLLSIAFANLIPKETYGTYKYILSIVGILSIPTLSGMGTAITQAIARGYEGSFIPALKIRIRWGLLGGLASLFLAGYYYFLNNPTLCISFLIAAVFLPIMDPLGSYDALLQGKKLFKVSTKYFIISQIVAIASLIITLVLTKNLYLILLAYFTSWTLMRFIFFKITSKKYIENNKTDLKTISYGKHLSLINVFGIVASYLDGILLFHYLGPASLAIYSFAIAPPEQLKGLVKNLNILALPKFSQRTKEELKTTMWNKVFKLSAVVASMVILYILIAPSVYKIFFPRYLDAVFYSQLFAASLIFSVAIIPYAVLQSQMAQKQLYWYNTVDSVSQIALLFVLIYFFGILGAIWARILTRFISMATAFWLVRKI